MPTARVEPASQRNAARVKVRDKQTNLNMIENMLIYFYLSVVAVAVACISRPIVVLSFAGLISLSIEGLVSGFWYSGNRSELCVGNIFVSQSTRF